MILPPPHRVRHGRINLSGRLLALALLMQWQVDRIPPLVKQVVNAILF